MTKQQILSEAMALEPDERESLAEELLLSVPSDPAVEAAWIEECKRRIAAVDAGQLPTVPGDQVMRQLRERLRK